MLRARRLNADVFWRRWEKDGGQALVDARAAAFAELANDPVERAEYEADPVAWASAFDAAWRAARRHPKPRSRDG